MADRYVGAACALRACGDACLEPGCECECHETEAVILNRAAAILRQRARQRSFWLDVICRVLTREATRIRGELWIERNVTEGNS
jgi:hypothetical protein